MQTKIKRKILSLALAVAMVFQTAMPTVFAAEVEEPAAKTITGFSDLEQTEYTLPIGAEQAEIDSVLTFPETITANVEYITTEEVVVNSGATIENGESNAPAEDAPATEDTEQPETGTDSEATKSESETAPDSETSLPLGSSSVQDSGDPETTLVEKTVSEEVELSVTWESDKELKTDAAGEFTYTAVLSDTDKGKYDFAEGVSLPTITVAVAAAVPMTMALNAVAASGSCGASLTYQIMQNNADDANPTYPVITLTVGASRSCPRFCHSRTTSKTLKSQAEIRL